MEAYRYKHPLLSPFLQVLISTYENKQKANRNWWRWRDHAIVCPHNSRPGSTSCCWQAWMWRYVEYGSCRTECCSFCSTFRLTRRNICLAITWVSNANRWRQSPRQFEEIWIFTLLNWWPVNKATPNQVDLPCNAWTCSVYILKLFNMCDCIYVHCCAWMRTLHPRQTAEELLSVVLRRSARKAGCLFAKRKTANTAATNE